MGGGKEVFTPVVGVPTNLRGKRIFTIPLTAKGQKFDAMNLCFDTS